MCKPVIAEAAGVIALDGNMYALNRQSSVHAAICKYSCVENKSFTYLLLIILIYTWHISADFANPVVSKSNSTIWHFLRSVVA